MRQLMTLSLIVVLPLLLAGAVLGDTKTAREPKKEEAAKQASLTYYFFDG